MAPWPQPLGSSAGRSPLEADLEAIQRQLEGSNPQLYRQLALYLQVLREVLPPSLDQACFHLATQVHGGRYAALAPERRQAFHRRLKQLVASCTSLLTVEQLAHLAGQMARERAGERLQRQRQRLLERLGAEDNDEDNDEDESSDRDRHNDRDDDDGRTAGRGARQWTLPQGSVRLDFNLPLGSGWLGWGRDVAAPDNDNQDNDPADPSEERDADPEASQQGPDPLAPNAAAGFEAELSIALDASLEEAIQEAMEGFLDDSLAEALQEDAIADDFGEPDPAKPAGSTAPAELSNLFSAFAAAAGMPEPFSLLGISAAGLGESPSPSSARRESSSADEQDDPNGAGDAEMALRLHQPPAADQAGALFEPPPGGGLLPRDPIALLAWLGGYERALARRLRNLSHAVNVELLRLGLCRTLLPLNLLEAVLTGQIEGQSAPANLLRLQLPISLGGLAGPLQVHGVLLRCADLELEQPQLRSVRRRLRQQHQESSKVAQQYHRLQRRLETRQAERLWSEDLDRLRPDPEGPPRRS